MKIRTGFVSNSSSSSFLIYKKGLTEDQHYAIKNHIEVAIKRAKKNKKRKNKYGSYDYFGSLDITQGWEIVETKYLYWLACVVDNFNADKFLEIEMNVPFKNFDAFDDYYPWGNELPKEIQDIDKRCIIMEREDKLKRILKEDGSNEK